MQRQNYVVIFITLAYFISHKFENYRTLARLKADTHKLFYQKIIFNRVLFQTIQKYANHRRNQQDKQVMILKLIYSTNDDKLFSTSSANFVTFANADKSNDNCQNSQPRTRVNDCRRPLEKNIIFKSNASKISQDHLVRRGGHYQGSNKYLVLNYIQANSNRNNSEIGYF